MGILLEFLPWKLLALLLGAAGLGLLALRDLKLAITLLLLTSATTGITLDTGTATAIPLGMLLTAFLVGIWILKMMVVDGKVNLQPSPLNLPLLAFLVVLLVSWVLGEAIWDWRLPVKQSNQFLVQAGQYAIFALSFAAAFLVAHQRLEERDLARWAWIVVLMGFTGMALELFLGIYQMRQQGLTGSILIWSVVLLVAQLLFNPGFKGWRRLAGFAFLAMWLFWVYTNRGWKGGWAPVLVGVFTLLLLYSWRWFAVALAGGSLLAWLNWDFLFRNFVSTEFFNAPIRAYFWYDILRMVSRSPLLGLGPANYKYYWNTQGFIPQSRLVAGWDIWDTWGFTPPSHNIFVDVFAQSGLVGLFFFLWGMGAAVWLVYRLSRRFLPGFTRAYVLGVLGSFVAMLVGSFFFADWLIPFVYNITITGFSHSVYSWVLLGSVLGLYQREKERLRGPET